MKKNILFQIDVDTHSSAFDAVVAIDAGVDHLIPYSNMTPDHLTGIVHGAIFTRGPEDLKSTAMFFGGSDVERADAAFHHAQSCFFGPLRVSLMCDPNGSNTTAVAAVLSASRHVRLEGQNVVVLGGTGPVGIRIAELCLRAGANVWISSRSVDNAKKCCDSLREKTNQQGCTPLAWASPDQALAQVPDTTILFSAGAAGVTLATRPAIEAAPSLRVAIDLNAVPPVGIEGVDPMDKGQERSGVVCYGAIGVGGQKMKIHKRCIQRLFESNDAVLDLNQIYQVGVETLDA